MRIWTRRGYEEGKKMLKCGCSLGRKVFTERKGSCSDYIAMHSLNNNVTDCICAWMKKEKRWIFLVLFTYLDLLFLTPSFWTPLP